LNSGAACARVEGVLAGEYPVADFIPSTVGEALEGRELGTDSIFSARIETRRNPRFVGTDFILLSYLIPAAAPGDPNIPDLMPR
jgi:hypothetical protein